MELIIKQFLCCHPLTEIDLAQITLSSWTEQETFLDNTVKLDLIEKHPINYKYQALFIKQIIRHLEEKGIEIHDDFYTYYCNTIKNPVEEHEYFYKHYKIDSENIITLKESSKLIADGTTGLRTWEAAKILSEWCALNSEIFKNKLVIELGSGVGLTGITVSKLCEPNRIYVTDCHPTVVNLLRDNVALNCNKPKLINIEVLKLPWENISERTFDKDISSPDILLAADVVYDPSVFKILIEAFYYFLNAKNNLQIILACTIRNSDTLTSFIKLLSEREFQVNELEAPKPNLFYWPASAIVKIYRIIK